VSSIDPPANVVELHRHDRDNPVILRSEILSMQWSSAINPPHGGASVILALPASKFDLAMPGDWMVIRDGRGRGVFFGHVVNVSDGLTIGANSAVVTAPFTIQAESWLDMLTRVEVFSPIAAALSESVGTLFTVNDWAGIVERIHNGRTFGYHGEALQEYFYALAQIQIPKSLGGGGSLSHLIPVVWNRKTQLDLAPDIVVESIPTAGSLPTHLSTFGTRSNVHHLLRGMFVPEPTLIELFPHMAPLYEDLPGENLEEIRMLPIGSEEEGQVPLAAPEVMGVDGTGGSWRAVGSESEVKTKIVRPARPTYQASPLAMYLRARPVLVYRVKPWRTRPLYQSLFSAVNEERRYVSTELKVDSKNPDDPNIVDFRQEQILREMFTQITWDKEYYTIVPTGRTISIDRTRSDSQRVNSSFMHLSVIDIPIIEEAGLPVKISKEIRRHGLRSSNPTWPFIIPPEDTSMGQDFVLYMRAIAAQIMQFYHRGHAFGSGSISIAGGGSISRYDYDPKTADFQFPLQAGRPFNISLPGKPFTGYADSVTNVIQVQGTKIVSDIKINYSRGVFGEDEDWLRDSMIPIVDIQSIEAARRKAAQRAAAPTKPVEEPEEVKACAEGAPVKDITWKLENLAPQPQEPYTSEQYQPAWLKSWVLSRVTDSATAKSLEEAFSGALGEIPKDFWISTLEPVYHRQNCWFVTACCYVIERYWRQIFPEATIAISSWLRTKDSDKYHRYSSAIDFTINTNFSSTTSINEERIIAGELPLIEDWANFVWPSKVPVFQSYGSLTQLINAGRIPLGGRGIYINANPDSGVKGVDPDQAGSASSSVAPPGGSGGIHYDIRGAFGIKIKRGTPQGQWWVAIDWTGDGKDEVQSGSTWEPPSKRATTTSQAQTPPPGLTPDQLRAWLSNNANEIEDSDNGTIIDDLANTWLFIADPDLSLKKRYLDTVPLPSDRPQRIKEMYYQPHSGSSKRTRESYTPAEEQSRVVLRDNVKNYVLRAARAAGNLSDVALPKVSGSVPNVLQVLGYEESCFYSNDAVATPPAQTTLVTGSAPTAAPAQPASTALATDPYGTFSKPASASATPRAPLVMVFGGTAETTGQRRESGVYMYDYVRPALTAGNNVFVAHRASNGRQPIDGLAADKAAVSQCILPLPSKVLFLFSGGQWPAQSIVSDPYQLSTYTKVYLVDPYLKNAFDFYKKEIKDDSSKFVFFYVLPPQIGTDPENGMTRAQVQELIAIPGLESIQCSDHFGANRLAVEHMINNNYVYRG
jgi:hypothetical protein